jgi:NAD(P)-dependent dehydrogenase (short-subunit alcohol dehydrogenase family)
LTRSIARFLRKYQAFRRQLLCGTISCELADINLTGSFTVAREAGGLMRAHGGGAIVAMQNQPDALGMAQRGAAAALRIAGRDRRAALFLMADRKASFVTGHILNVDGGLAAAGYLPVRP